MYVYIDSKRSKKWYYRLVSGSGHSLEDEYTTEELHSGIIVCWSSSSLPDGSEFVNSKGKSRKVYTLFDDYIELYNYMKEFDIEYKCFFEMIPGEKAQKIKFDLDLKDVSGFGEIGELIEELLVSIQRVLAGLGHTIIPDQHLLVYSSNSETQRSYHVVVDGLYCANVWEVQAFYDRIVGSMEHPLKDDVIDRAVYSSNQQFRILGSQKYGSGRPKILDSSWPHTIPSDQPAPYHLLRSSLVGFTSDSVQLPPIYVKPQRVINYQTDEEDLHKALKIFFEQFEDRDCFDLREVLPNYIVLNRLRPSYCNVCSKSHEAENPYLYVENGGIYFSCRRSLGRTFVGLIETPIPEELPINRVPTTSTDSINLAMDELLDKLDGTVQTDLSKPEPLYHLFEEGPEGPPKPNKRKERLASILDLL